MKNVKTGLGLWMMVLVSFAAEASNSQIICEGDSYYPPRGNVGARVTQHFRLVSDRNAEGRFLEVKSRVPLELSDYNTDLEPQSASTWSVVGGSGFLTVVTANRGGVYTFSVSTLAQDATHRSGGRLRTNGRLSIGLPGASGTNLGEEIDMECSIPESLEQ